MRPVPAPGTAAAALRPPAPLAPPPTSSAYDSLQSSVDHFIKVPSYLRLSSISLPFLCVGMPIKKKKWRSTRFGLGNLVIDWFLVFWIYGSPVEGLVLIILAVDVLFFVF